MLVISAVRLNLSDEWDELNVHRLPVSCSFSCRLPVKSVCCHHESGVVQAVSPHIGGDWARPLCERRSHEKTPGYSGGRQSAGHIASEQELF